MVIEILLAAAVVGGSLAFRGVRKFLKSKFVAAEAQGSAFVKVAEADAKELEVKGRIIALDAATKVKNDAIALYEKEVERVHADAEAVKTAFDNILAKL